MTVTHPVRMHFSLQDPFNFNVEISVSWYGCRYHDPAGFMPRVRGKASGAPPLFRPDPIGSAGIGNLQLGQGISALGNLTVRHAVFMIAPQTQSLNR
jgi:hypothetical protein